MLTYAPNFIVDTMKVVKDKEDYLKKLQEKEKRNDRDFSIPANLQLKEGVKNVSC